MQSGNGDLVQRGHIALCWLWQQSEIGRCLQCVCDVQKVAEHLRKILKGCIVAYALMK